MKSTLPKQLLFKVITNTTAAFKANVEDRSSGRVIVKLHNKEPEYSGEVSLVVDGYMTHRQDAKGLLYWLKTVGLVANDASIRLVVGGAK